MSTLKGFFKVHSLKTYRNKLAITAAFLLASCASEESRVLHMSQYDPNRGERPEFMLRGYEDYKIKVSREDFRVENKISFDEISEMFGLN